MAKRKVVSKQAGRPKTEESTGKTRVELRFDSEVYVRIKDLADQAEISVNQLMHGLARWASEKLWVGEPVRDPQGNISHNRNQKGCLWAGETVTRCAYSPEERRKILEDYEHDPQVAHHIVEDGYIDENHKGKIYVFLDFTERRVVREE